MLGSDVEALLKKGSIKYFASDIEVSISKIDEIKHFISGKNIQWIINTAAYTNVDGAEKEVDEALAVNSQAVRNLAEISKENNMKLIHISTDYVFDGKKAKPYIEGDLTNPINMYGKSKLQGEDAIRDILEEHFIIRTSWLYGENGKNFVYTIIKLLKNRDSIKIINDQYGTPTYTKDLATVITMITKENLQNYGTYHFTNEGIITWYEFAKEIYSMSRDIGLINSKVDIIPVSTEEYPTAAVRPRNSALAKEKIKTKMNVDIRNWKDCLKDFLMELKECEN